MLSRKIVSEFQEENIFICFPSLEQLGPANRIDSSVKDPEKFASSSLSG